MSARHCLHVIFFMFFLYCCCSITNHNNQNAKKCTYYNERNKSFGPLFFLLLFICRFCVLLMAPESLFNFLGLVMYETFPPKPTLKCCPKYLPFICIRIVTRGDYPDLIKFTLKYNVKNCLKAGLTKFMFEIVTNQKIVDLPEIKGVKIQQTVVPEVYTTKSGSMFKSRNLQYCLESDVNGLGDNDWIGMQFYSIILAIYHDPFSAFGRRYFDDYWFNDWNHELLSWWIFPIRSRTTDECC